MPQTFLEKLIWVLGHRPADNPKPKPAPLPSPTSKPVYKDGLNDIQVTAMTQTPSYPIDPPNQRRGLITLRAHLVKQAEISPSEKGARRWVEYQSKWNMGEACQALRRQPLQAPDTRALAKITYATFDDKQTLDWRIGCRHSNGRTMARDPYAPAEYDCAVDQDISFVCTVTWIPQAP